jgi:hypothetical protein
VGGGGRRANTFDCFFSSQKLFSKQIALSCAAGKTLLAVLKPIVDFAMLSFRRAEKLNADQCSNLIFFRHSKSIEGASGTNPNAATKSAFRTPILKLTTYQHLCIRECNLVLFRFALLTLVVKAAHPFLLLRQAIHLLPEQ